MTRFHLTPALLALAAAPALAQDVQPRMGDPIPGLTASEADLFFLGQTAFLANVTEAEGAGPIFNEASCAACHNQPATGGFGTRTVTRFGKAASGGAAFDPLDNLGGTLRQDQSFDPNCAETIPAQADVIASRITPICFGAGLLEAISEADLMANEAAQGGLGLSGYRRLFAPLEGGPARTSRFGWKGGPSTVMSFSIDAGLNEMGLTSVFLPTENAPNGDLALLALCDGVPDPEDAPDVLGFTKIDRFTHFQQMLAPPPQTPRSGMAGEPLFVSVGCADCHRVGYTTGAHPIAALSGQDIRPYSDFLIHDVGSTLGDGIVDGPVSETQHMTRALWGLSQRSGLLHDGRATGGTPAGNVESAILQHGGEALASANAYAALPQGDKDALLAYLLSFGQAEFDFERDHDVDEFDWFFISSFLNGPAPATAITADDAAAICDLDQDGDFDIVEFGALQRAFTGQ